ncbi:hypothetical protein B0H10DRAFT_1964581 [Mycena sp. CBHHK59/15]|nr:hypothetical protein B0H10DRAFT_1964581 [Mycena sp. CBHHK59/15]
MARSGPPAATQASSNDTSRAASPSTKGSLDGTPPADREPVALPKSRPVTPKLLYSWVVTADPAPAMEFGIVASPLVTPKDGPELSEFSSLDPAVEFGLRRSHESPVEAPWTEVTRKTARSHSERSTSPTTCSPLRNDGGERSSAARRVSHSPN